uniref:Microtubule-associated protein Jupiter n=1 Tax=Lygus hesperus TaxID=30085 RepID=A0A0A9XE04_LYGHE
MTSTGTFQGMNLSRNSSKVLKPPGGGSSDIFGSNDEGGAARRVQKNHLASNVFLSDEPAPSTPARSPGNSHSRLFGPASPPKASPRPNRSVSKILPFDAEGNEAASNGNSPLKGLSPSKSVTNGDAHDAADAPMTNGNTSPITNGNRITNGGSQITNGGAQAQAPASRNRVPPGGYSSGLW